MPLQATSGAASYDAFGGGVPAVPQYIEDVFSTYLYTGNGPSSQTITNGIDLAGKGGLVWTKARTQPFALNNSLIDTVRGNRFQLYSDLTNAQADLGATVTNQAISSFNSNGFTLGGDQSSGCANYSSSATYVSWTFRKQPKFFDVVTYTGTGSNTTISHSLGSVPACIMVKRTDTTGAWQVYHRSLANTQYLVLNTTAAVATGATRWNSTTPTSTVFSLGTDATVNASGGTYVAYLFAHDAGGFGLTGTDNVISCGTFTADDDGNANINLGYEPQWVMMKVTNITGSWFMNDNMRGMPVDTAVARLFANLSQAENTASGGARPNSTGFNVTALGPNTYIYIAIRRGPMKVPTSGTSVFSPNALNAPTDGTQVTTGFPTDLSMWKARGGSYSGQFQDRLRGLPSTAGSGTVTLYPDSTAAESSNQTGYEYWNTGFKTYSGENNIWWSFRRAPSFFDMVCWTATGSPQTISHNLGAIPEMMIRKRRDSSTGGQWDVYVAPLGASKKLQLESTSAEDTNLNTWTNTTPTSSVMYMGNTGSGWTFVTYLFATCAGVSKVGSYTGNGSSQTINCGFTGGARFVLVKATSTTGNWIVADSARGIVAGNDPALYLNSTAAEVTGLDWIDADNSGFVVNETATIAANTNGVSYIFLAIA
jgi:hypothetical protein